MCRCDPKAGYCSPECGDFVDAVVILQKYKITIIDNRNSDTYETEVEAKTAQDALTIADFNICQKSTDINNKPTSRVYRITAE